MKLGEWIPEQDGGMERPVDFTRDRRMRCGECGHTWTVDLEWVDRWSQGDEACSGCGTTCEAETAARFTIREDDPALDVSVAKRLTWYHTSTRPDWPTAIDFAATLEEDTQRRMGSVSRWAERQANKALHVGTYESAIHNMLRRLRDQPDQGNQFYVYRVHLNPEVVMHAEWITDPSNWLGDVWLDEICPPEAEAVRYVNFHEDPGGLSLAIKPSAIRATQRLAIPLPVVDDTWIRDAVTRLSSEPPDQPLPPELRVHHRMVFGESARAKTAAAASKVLVDRLPLNLQDQFEGVTRWHSDSEPTEWARCAAGLAALIEDPQRVLAELDAQATCER